MADLKTTAEERARVVATPGAMPWVKVLYLVHDIDTLLAENARLRAALHNAWPEVSARLRAAEAALRGMLRAHPNCHEEGCGGYGCGDNSKCAAARQP